MNQYITEIEEECETNLDWYYHATCYAREKYKSILTEGIKCNALLNKSGYGVYNGKYFVSLSKLIIPNNKDIQIAMNSFLYYSTKNPSFIIEGINPIPCKNNSEYEPFIYTRDKRRMGKFYDEYQYYYLIKNTYIKGIVYNLLNYFLKEELYQLKNLEYLISLLEELNLDIPIYDYSRRDKTLVHKINKEKFKYYQKKV